MSGPGAIHHLNCGTMCPRGARMLSGTGGLLAEARLVCHCLLIEGADGLVLIDTGFGTGDVADRSQLGGPFNAIVRPRLLAEETAHAQIIALGLDPADVRHIVTTHLDLDHAGGLPDFPAAEVHLLGKELTEAMNPGWRERQRYVASHWAHGPHWVEHETGGDEWLGFEGIRILPGSDAEILLIPLPGHTLGHTGVAIRDGEGWLLHCGDAYFHQGEVQTPPHCPPGLRLFEALNQADGASRKQNLERLRELAERHRGEVELICSHDASTLDALAPGA
ncbi:MAG TPA: MBL fold metallo-hydrolase [Solirubrobacteraceae bacterium]|nr:MBL fold metallo-hydrolase [Solirubrobacteraceae bacterium]